MSIYDTKPPEKTPPVVRLQRTLESMLGRSSDQTDTIYNAQTPRKPKPTAKPEKRARAAPRAVSQKRYLAYSTILEEAGTPALLRGAIIGICALLSVAMLWSALTEVTEIAAAPGEVIPTGQVKEIQHLEGGIVSAILVKDGELVEKGAVLLRLGRAGALAELDQARAKEIALRSVAKRLTAFASGKPIPAFDAKEAAKYGHLIKDQLEILEQQRRAWTSQRTVIKSQIRTRQAQIRGLETQERSLQRELAITAETFQMRLKLFGRKVTSRTDMLRAKRDYEKVVGELSEVRTDRDQAKAAVVEARLRLEELDAKLRQDALVERGKVTAELAQVRERVRKLTDRVKRLEIRAPIRGRVKGMAINTLGGVIAPGQKVMEIVPKDRELVVHSRISTRDVGHVAVGQRVRVKVDSYEHVRYGIVPGRLSSISATTFQDKDGPPYYRGTVVLDRSYVSRKAGTPILAGMTVQTEIVTGSKSLLAYLLKPIRQATEQAFRER